MCPSGAFVCCRGTAAKTHLLQSVYRVELRVEVPGTGGLCRHPGGARKAAAAAAAHFFFAKCEMQKVEQPREDPLEWRVGSLGFRVCESPSSPLQLFLRVWPSLLDCSVEALFGNRKRSKKSSNG